MTITHFPFDRAVFCLECQAVSDSTTDTCPACGSKGLINMARAFKQLTHQHVYDSAIRTEFADGSFWIHCECGEPLKLKAVRKDVRA
jgi:hypothetical protein